MTTNRKTRKAGHRSWASRNQRIPGGNRGDIMSPEKRSRLMARIQGKNTTPERIIESAFRNQGFEFERHDRSLPGCPDFVFRERLVAVFVDGDFWHGWRFPLWEEKLTPRWREKIAANRARDRRNFARLRRLGWRIVRIWEHQVEADPAQCVLRVQQALERKAFRMRTR